MNNMARPHPVRTYMAGEEFLLICEEAALEVPGEGCCNRIVYRENGPDTFEAYALSPTDVKLKLCINGLAALAREGLSGDRRHAIAIHAFGLRFQFARSAIGISMSLTCLAEQISIAPCGPLAGAAAAYSATFVSEHLILEGTAIDQVDLLAMRTGLSEGGTTTPQTNIHLFERVLPDVVRARTLGGGQYKESICSGAGAVLTATILNTNSDWTGYILYPNGSRFHIQGGRMVFPGATSAVGRLGS